MVRWFLRHTEGYSQPRRPLVFAQVRDRLPRPVNKPHGVDEAADGVVREVTESQGDAT